METTQNQLSYMQAFEQEYGTLSIDACKTDIVKVVMFSTFLPANFRATSIPYVRVDNMLVKHEDLLSLFEKLGRGGTLANTVSPHVPR